MDKISAVVVSYNEAHLLDACLKSIEFCDEIIVVDLESEDNTKEIAAKYNAKYIWHNRVPVVEIIHTWIQDKVENEWMLITDPDEVCSASLAKDLKQIIPNLPNNIGSIQVPWRYYFGNKMLKGTQWGGVQGRVFVVNTNRFYFTDEVHRGRHLKKGMEMYRIKYNGHNHLHHYWMQNKQQLRDKHRRYLKQEGVSMHKSGKSAKLYRIPYTYLSAFYHSWFQRKGWKDGLTGLYLSFFWAWYSAAAEYALYKYQKTTG